MKFAREHSFDNIRFLLMFLVVFGHFIEIAVPFPGSILLYRVIYSFHMPAFIFLFGYFARFSPKRIALSWCLPYVVFQTLYMCFGRFVLKDGAALIYTTPYWLLWFMPVCIFYQLLLPVYDTDAKTGQAWRLGIACALALTAGFDNSIGYYLSISRFLVFQPFFMLGMYCRKNGTLSRINVSRKLCAVSVCAVLLCILFVYCSRVPAKLLYGSYSYSAAGSSVFERAAVMAAAGVWIFFIFVVLRPRLNMRLPLITSIGRYTWPVFLLHGFVVKALPVIFPGWPDSLWLAFGAACVIMPVLGNRFCQRIVDFAGLRRKEN